jgi:hypothetical protein
MAKWEQVWNASHGFYLRIHKDPKAALRWIPVQSPEDLNPVKFHQEFSEKQSVYNVLRRDQYQDR